MADTRDTVNTSTNGPAGHHDLEKATKGMSHEEKHTAVNAARFGYGPLAHFNTSEGALPGKKDGLPPSKPSSHSCQPSVVNSNLVSTRASRDANSATQLPSVSPLSPSPPLFSA